VLIFWGRRHADALALLDRAISIDPSHALAWTFRGMCKASVGKEEEAIKDIEHALRLNPATRATGCRDTPWHGGT
jgi:tetratricopeptide (TPR) repeat protein